MKKRNGVIVVEIWRLSLRLPSSVRGGARWMRESWELGLLAHERQTPQAPQQPSVALSQHHPGAADAASQAPATTEPRPTSPPPAHAPPAHRTVFCAAPSAPSAPPALPAICNHTRLGVPPRTPNTPTHTRAGATIDGARCEATLLLSEVRLGPLETTAPFSVVPGVAFAALLGLDFLYEHEIAVSLARHSLIFEGHGGKLFPLLGHHLRLAPLCALAQDVALHPGNTAWVRTTLRPPATAPTSPLVYLVAASTLPSVGLAIPEQLTSGLIVIRNTSDRPLHLTARWPIAKAVRLPPAAIPNVRLVATDRAPPPAGGTADTPAYDKVPGDFISTLSLPNSCLLPTELQQLRDLLHEFRDRFNDGSERLPATCLLKATLDTGDAQPISTPPRRLSLAMRQGVRDVAELDAQEITEPSTGCWSTPIVMRMVDLLLGCMKWVSAVSYIDDIIVYNDTWDAHRAHLRQVFQALRDANLQLPPGNCSFGNFGDAGSQNGQSRPALPRQMPVLSQPRARRISLGRLPPTPPGARCAKPSSEPVLAHPDCTRPFYLDCDGSGDALGAELLNPYDGGERVVAYSSRSLLDHERKWTATELEAAALIWALQTFRHYIDTIEVCTHTDHASLEYIRHNSSQCRRLKRWALRLQEFRFKVIHRPGAQQEHVDCLSRAPLPPTATQRPIILDEFPSRMVLHARAEHPVPASPSKLWCAPLCAAVEHVAHSAHRWMRLLRHRLRHLCAAVRAAGPPAQPSTSGSDDDGNVQVCLTDSDDDTPPPPTAQPPDNALAKVIHRGRSIPLPPAVEHLSLKDAQAQDPECQGFLRLARTPRAAWPPHLRRTPLQFCVPRDLVYVRIGDALPRLVLPATFRSRAIQAHHLSYYGGHFGIFKTAARLACRYWWPHLQRDVGAYFRRCPFCIANTDAPRTWKWLNLPIGILSNLSSSTFLGPCHPPAGATTTPLSSSIIMHVGLNSSLFLTLQPRRLLKLSSKNGLVAGENRGPF
ncbi:hypothetical protein Emag_006301 [Eimeria magna]